jgi:branched-chain amino acid transport system ATP-binding protein
MPLVVDTLNAFYGKSQVVFDLSLAVHRGEIVTVLGRNGAGKTSALKAIAGLIHANALSVAIDGREASTFPAFRRVRAGLGFSPSGSRVFPNLTVEENLGIVRSRRTAAKLWTVMDVYARFPKLASLRQATAGSLSGGERQMLAIGRALLTNPVVLMMDEPSEGLAPVIVRALADMLRSLSEEGLAILLTEQNYRVALDLADRVVFVEKGRAAWQGNSQDASAADVLMRYLAI